MDRGTLRFSYIAGRRRIIVDDLKEWLRSGASDIHVSR
jgi:hypothetical protein